VVRKKFYIILKKHTIPGKCRRFKVESWKKYSRGKTLNIVSRKATNTKIFPIHFHCPITIYINIKDIKRLKGQIKLWEWGGGAGTSGFK
jgi:hypothetical protein